MATATTATLIAAGVSTAATVYSIDRQQAASRAQERAREKQQVAANAQNQRSRQSAINRARRRRAAVAARAEAQGASGGSAVQGAQGSLATQLATNVGFQQNMMDINQQVTSLNNTVARRGRQAQIGGAIANAPGQLGFDTASGFQDLADMFGNNARTGNTGRQSFGSHQTFQRY